jgi:cell division septation protein DedD
MAFGGKRGAGERVLESKHVIGLFLLMLLFSAVFFTLGYVMGRNQYDGQVRSAANGGGKEPLYMPQEPTPKKTVEQPTVSGVSDPATTSSNPDWEFYGNNKPANSEPRLDSRSKTPPVTAPSKAVNARATSKAGPEAVPPAPVKSSKAVSSGPAIPNGAAVLQVAALLRQEDALAIANTLQKKHFAAFVQPPQKDKYYRVQVGPFKDQKAAEAAKKGLEGEGFKAFYVKH